MNDSDAEQIARIGARCHAPRKAGRKLKKAIPMRFKKRTRSVEWICGLNLRIEKIHYGKSKYAEERR